jgi:hypothetical protein
MILSVAGKKAGANAPRGMSMDLANFTDPQAQATIEAARIGAAAAIHAAWIQASAAAGALAAGVLAYIGAVRQVRIQERAHEVRALAYRFRLLRVVEEYHEQVARACAVAESQLAAFRSGSASVTIASFQLLQPRMLHDDNWEAHALLGRRAVELILLIDDLSQRLAKFDQEIRGEGTRTDSSFARGSLRERDATEAGQPAYAPEHAIVDYAEVLDRLRAALAALIRELAEPEPTLPWRKLRLPGRRHADRMTRRRGRAPVRRTAMAIRRPHHARRAQPPSGAPIDRLFVRTRFELTSQSRARTASLTLASAKRLTRERSRRLSLAAAQAERRQGRVPADAAPEGSLTDRIAGATPPFARRRSRRPRRQARSPPDLGFYWGRPPGTRRPRLFALPSNGSMEVAGHDSAIKQDCVRIREEACQRGQVRVRRAG